MTKGRTTELAVLECRGVLSEELAEQVTQYV